MAGTTLRTYGKGEATTIKVELWPDGRDEFYVTSSQVCCPSLDAWIDSDADLISQRLGQGGREKGRVLFAWQDRAFRGRCAVAAALLHLQGTGPRFQLMRILSIEDYKRHGAIWAVDSATVLLSCIHQLVVKTGDPCGCFDWLFDNKSAAENAQKRFCQDCRARVTSPLGHGRGRAQRAQIELERCLPR